MRLTSLLARRDKPSSSASKNDQCTRAGSANDLQTVLNKLMAELSAEIQRLQKDDDLHVSSDASTSASNNRTDILSNQMGRMNLDNTESEDADKNGSK